MRVARGALTSIVADTENCGPGHIDPFVDYAKDQHYLVRFKAPSGQRCWEILMRAGECWIEQSDMIREERFPYGCMGRAGERCADGPSRCSNWGANSLREDVCSYF